MSERPKRIIYTAEDENACTWYRCVTPGRALIGRGHDVTLVSALTAEMVDRADVLVFQRVHHPGLDAVSYARGLGKLTVYDIDDDLWSIHPDSGAYAFYSQPGLLSTTEEAIRACELVTTTTRPLAGRLKRLNRNTIVLPNMLPDEYWRLNEPREQEESRVVIGWAGSDTHLPDLKLLRGVIEQLLAESPVVEFAWAGMSEMPFEDHRRMRMLPLVPIEEYPSLLDNFHIGLAPVVDSVFNRSKSDLKFLEYAARGIPVVASRTPAYEASIDMESAASWRAMRRTGSST